MNDVLNRLADEADKIIDNVNKAERRMDVAAPDYAVLQGVKLDAMRLRLDILQITPEKKK